MSFNLFVIILVLVEISHTSKIPNIYEQQENIASDTFNPGYNPSYSSEYLDGYETKKKIDSESLNPNVESSYSNNTQNEYSLQRIIETKSFNPDVVYIAVPDSNEIPTVFETQANIESDSLNKIPTGYEKQVNIESGYLDKILTGYETHANIESDYLNSIPTGIDTQANIKSESLHTNPTKYNTQTHEESESLHNIPTGYDTQANIVSDSSNPKLVASHTSEHQKGYELQKSTHVFLDSKVSESQTSESNTRLELDSSTPKNEAESSVYQYLEGLKRELGAAELVATNTANSGTTTSLTDLQTTIVPTITSTISTTASPIGPGWCLSPGHHFGANKECVCRELCLLDETSVSFTSCLGPNCRCCIPIITGWCLSPGHHFGANKEGVCRELCLLDETSVSCTSCLGPNCRCCIPIIRVPPTIPSSGPITTNIPRPECDLVCSLLNRPACGSDGKTYPNHCVLLDTSCRHPKDNITFLYKGECGIGTTAFLEVSTATQPPVTQTAIQSLTQQHTTQIPTQPPVTQTAIQSLTVQHTKQIPTQPAIIEPPLQPLETQSSTPTQPPTKSFPTQPISKQPTPTQLPTTPTQPTPTQPPTKSFPTQPISKQPTPTQLPTTPTQPTPTQFPPTQPQPAPEPPQPPPTLAQSSPIQTPPAQPSTIVSSPPPPLVPSPTSQPGGTFQSGSNPHTSHSLYSTPAGDRTSVIFTVPVKTLGSATESSMLQSKEPAQNPAPLIQIKSSAITSEQAAHQDLKQPYRHCPWPLVRYGPPTRQYPYGRCGPPSDHWSSIRRRLSNRFNGYSDNHPSHAVNSAAVTGIMNEGSDPNRINSISSRNSHSRMITNGHPIHFTQGQPQRALLTARN